MKKLLQFILFGSLAIFSTGCASQPKADFESMNDWALAAQNGEDIEGKTVAIEASEDEYEYMDGYWYFKASSEGAGDVIFVEVDGTKPNVKAGDTIVIEPTEAQKIMGTTWFKYNFVEDN